jgi:hypothetical protein
LTNTFGFATSSLLLSFFFAAFFHQEKSCTTTARTQHHQCCCNDDDQFLFRFSRAGRCTSSAPLRLWQVPLRDLPFLARQGTVQIV